MRIVDVCAFYAPQGGGVKTYVERKLHAGAAAGHDIIILAPGEKLARRPARGGSVVTIPAKRFPLDRRYHYFDDEAALHRMLDALAPDLVEASSPWSSASMVARWRGDVPRALVMHADPLSAYAYRWFGNVAPRAAIDRGFDWYWRHLRRLGQAFDMVVSANDSLSARLRAGGVGSVCTVPMGVEPHIFTPSHRDAALRRHLLARCGLDENGLLLMGVGRHAPEKRWPMVIQAATLAGYRRPVGLVLLGDGRDSARVRRAAAHNPHIHLLAPTTDRRRLASLLASADALVHGCEAETFCMTAAEARASGVPVIVPDEGGAADHARSGIGLRFRAGDTASLVEAIENFAGTDPDIWRSRAATAAASVTTMDEHFSWLFEAYSSLRTAVRHAA